MKFIKRYNEGLRDQMIPKTEDDIRSSIKKKLGVEDDIISIHKWNPNEEILVSTSSDIKQEIQGNVSILTGDVIKIYNWCEDYLGHDPTLFIQNAL